VRILEVFILFSVYIDALVYRGKLIRLLDLLTPFEVVYRHEVGSSLVFEVSDRQGRYLGYLLLYRLMLCGLVVQEVPSKDIPHASPIGLLTLMLLLLSLRHPDVPTHKLDLPQVRNLFLLVRALFRIDHEVPNLLAGLPLHKLPFLRELLLLLVLLPLVPPVVVLDKQVLVLVLVEHPLLLEFRAIAGREFDGGVEVLLLGLEVRVVEALSVHRFVLNRA
jgi:hypothetical protein